MNTEALELTGTEATIETDVDVQARRDHEHLEAIKEAERKVAQRESEWESAKADAADAKKRYDAAVEHLRDVITSSDEPRLPFGETEQPETWQAVRLETLGIPQTIVTLLDEGAGLQTVGALAEFTKRNRLTDISGVGIAKAEQIEAALESFWADHPEYTKPATSGVDDAEDTE